MGALTEEVMERREMHTKIDVAILADAFPTSVRASALEAGTLVYGSLHQGQWFNRERFTVVGEEIQIPRRLRIDEASPYPRSSGVTGQMVACLLSQSCDGFQRQLALQSIVRDVQYWSAPFVVALIGEYIVEIIEDIAAAMTPSNVDALTGFIIENPGYWEITKQRVGSYRNVYYRGRYTKRSYPGFKLVNDLQSELRSRNQ